MGLTKQEQKAEKARQDLLKQLAKFIKEDCGDECPDFKELCVKCEVYRALTVLKRFYETE